MREIGIEPKSNKIIGSKESKMAQYVSRVMSYMAFGLTISTVVVYYLMTVTQIGSYFFSEIISESGAFISVKTTGLWIAVVVLEIALILGMIFIRTGSYKLTLALYMLFSASIGITTSPLILMFEPASVLSVLFMTIAIFAVCAIYGYTTKRDLTKLGSLLMVSLICMIIAGVVNFFLKSPMFHYVLSWIGVFVFIGFIAYDMQKIKKVNLNSPDLERDAILSALDLYLDFINLFIKLLSIFGKRR